MWPSLWRTSCGDGELCGSNQELLLRTNQMQGGRTWQPFVGGKNGHEKFRQARIYNFRDKCVVFARNRKFANLTK